MATYNGTAFADEYVGTSSSDTINGNGGDDYLEGAGGADTINGGEGADLLVGGSGNDSLNGGNGDDGLFDDAGNDTFNGGAGFDIAYYYLATAGVTVNLSITGAQNTIGAGTDTLTGIEGLSGSVYNDTLIGDANGNLLEGDAGRDHLSGGGGDDLLLVLEWSHIAAGERYSGGAGWDLLWIDGGGNLSSTTIDADIEELYAPLGVWLTGAQLDQFQLIDGSGIWITTGGVVDLSDNLVYASDFTVNTTNAVTLSLAGSTAAAYNIFGNSGADVLTGGTLNDSISGGLGNDKLYGGAGADDLDGNDGDDILDGQDGNDILQGHFGADTLNGGGGEDTFRINYLDGSLAGDHLIGGAGVDTIEISSQNIDFTGMTVEGVERVWAYGYYLFMPAELLNQFDYVYAPGIAITTAGTVDFTGKEQPTHGFELDVAGITLILRGDEENPDSIYEVVNGSNGVDTIYGGWAVNEFRGQGGDDILVGGGWNDILTGGAGADYMDGGAGADQFLVHAGDVDAGDQYIGGDGYDIIRLDSDVLLDGALSSIEEVAADGEWLLVGPSMPDGVGKVTAANLKIVGPGVVDLSGAVVAADAVWLDTAGITLMLDASGGGLVIHGRAGDDTVIGGMGLAYGGGGNDTLTGGDQVDKIYGEDGDDILDGAGGADIVKGDLGNDQLSGGDGDDLVHGGDGADTLLGGLGADELHGELDNDIIHGGGGEDFVLGEGGDDSIDGGADNDSLFGDAGDDQILGGDGDDRMYGQDGADTLDGGAGADELRGGAGADTVAGGDGDDIIFEVAGEAAGGHISGGDGWDTLKIEGVVTGVTIDEDMEFLDVGWSSVNIDADALGVFESVKVRDLNIDGPGVADLTGATLEVHYLNITTAEGVTLVLTGANCIIDFSVNGGAGDDVIYGTDGDDVLEGRDGDDFISGGAGWDILTGGNGWNTVSYADATTSMNITLAPHPDYFGYGIAEGEGQIEQIANFQNAIGSAFDDIITGTEVRNRLDGGAGADTLSGGLGNDTYVVDNVGDVVTELAGEGGDTVEASVDYTLAANVENLVLTGAALMGIGNTRPNVITGNASANTLDGAGGVDTLSGLGGDDILRGGTGADTLDGGQGFDLADYSDKSAVVVADFGSGTLTVGGVSEDTLISIEGVIGGSGNDSLTGSGGLDRLNGGLGDDYLKGAGGADDLDGGDGEDIADYSDKTQTVTVTLNGSADVTVTVAKVAEDTLANIENVTGGSARDVLTGDDLANELRGGGGSDALTGGGGDDLLDGGIANDVLKGGAGDDTYVIDHAGDLATEALNQGTDLVQSSVTWALGANFENLTLTGTGAVNGTGNGLNNVITGNYRANILIGGNGDDVLQGGEGNDRLDGGAGVDTMEGGLGNDTYVVSNTLDILTELAGEGADTIEARIGWTLADNFENLTLTGINNAAGTGNSVANIILGNDANNVLSGLGGNDRLEGNGGNDTLLGGDGADILRGGSGLDTMTGGAGGDRFLFDEAELAGLTSATCDRIVDFSSADKDRIGLTDIDADTATADIDEAFTFIGTAAFSGTAGELRYEQAGGLTLITGDTNGDGVADFMIRLDGLHTLVAGHFFL